MSHINTGTLRPVLQRAVIVAALALSASALAQSPIGPRPAPPPTYGAPVAPAIQGYESTNFSGHGFTFTLDVDLAEAQNFVPAGYTVLPSTTGATTARISAILALDNLLTLRVPVGDFAAGTYGPFNSLGLVVATLAPSGFIELVSLAVLVDNSEIADLQQALQGPGSSRLADIEVKVQEAFGHKRIRARVRDLNFGLRLNLSLAGPAEITVQNRVEFPLPLRSVNGLASPPTPNVRSFVITRNDASSISDAAALEVEGRLRLSGGKLPIVAAQPVGFYWNNENFAKIN